MNFIKDLARRFPILARLVAFKLGIRPPETSKSPNPSDNLPPEAVTALGELQHSAYLKTDEGKTAKRITVKTLRGTDGLIRSVKISCRVPKLKRGSDG